MARLSDEKRLAIVRWSTAIGIVASALLCSPLWLSRRAYPFAPVFDSLPLLLPRPFDLVFLLALGALLVVTVLRPSFQWAPRAFLVGYVFLVLSDQSRLQPWAYQYAILLGILTFAPTPRSTLNASRVLLVGIYFWSGAQKLNGDFAAILYPWLWEPVTRHLPTALAEVPQLFAPLVPFFELGLGIALLLPRARVFAVFGLIAMHTFVLAVLGPWARGWNSVIWPWNLVMMVLLSALFFKSWEPARRILRNRLLPVQLVTASLALFLPVLSLFGAWDLFLSFSLYSGNPIGGELLLSSKSVERLDPEIRAFAKQQSDDHYLISFDQWSFAVFDLPAYPSERVHRKLARKFCTLLPTEEGFGLRIARGAEWGFRPGWRKVLIRAELCE